MVLSVWLVPEQQHQHERGTWRKHRFSGPTEPKLWGWVSATPVSSGLTGSLVYVRVENHRYRKRKQSARSQMPPKKEVQRPGPGGRPTGPSDGSVVAMTRGILKSEVQAAPLILRIKSRVEIKRKSGSGAQTTGESESWRADVREGRVWGAWQ